MSNRVFETYDEIIEAACDAWQKLTAKAETITSIGMLQWAHVGQTQLPLVLFQRVTDLGGLGGMWWRAEQRVLWLVVLAVSFGVSFAQVTVLAAVLLRSDFGGKGDGGNDRLARWKAGGSAELERDEPLG